MRPLAVRAICSGSTNYGLDGLTVDALSVVDDDTNELAEFRWQLVVLECLWVWGERGLLRDRDITVDCAKWKFLNRLGAASWAERCLEVTFVSVMHIYRNVR